MCLAEFSRNFVFIFSFMWMQLYCLRLLGSTYRRLVFQDYKYICCTAVLVAAILIFNDKIINALLFIIFILIYLLQWVNIIVFQNFGIKVNWHVLKIFKTGIGHFKDEFQALFPKLTENLKLLLFPIFVIIVYICLFFLAKKFFFQCLIAFAIFFLATVTKSKIDKKTIFFWISLVIIGQIVIENISVFLLRINFISVVVYNSLACLFLITVLVLTIINSYSQKIFYRLPLMLIEQFKEDKIPISILQQEPEIKAEDRALIKLTTNELQKSEQFAVCRKASIILVTVESLTNFYFDEQFKQSDHMPFFTDLSRSGIVSAHHISPSPLTNNALNAIYRGNYFGKDYPHLQALKKLGYQTCFLTSQKSAEFNMHQLLNTIGFEHIIDNVTISNNNRQRISDPDFFAQAEKYLKNSLDLQQPFFLHIINNQTHGPYFTYQKKVIDRKQRYLQAIKETDQQLKQLLQQFEYLRNTIIIYTGDHGESFAEDGYTSHANAIIQPQIQVPFLISHPALSGQKINFSTHFDIFPTIFDLLGCEYPYQVLGNSLFNPVENKHCFVYSETKIGNTPSSFGIVTPKNKIHFDRQMQNYQIRALNDNVLQNLTGDAYDYYLKLLISALQQYKLLQ